VYIGFSRIASPFFRFISFLFHVFTSTTFFVNLAHENLEPCVGECVSAFCSALLSGSVRPGIWFPEEAIVGKEDIAAVLGLSGVGAHTLKVESDDGLQNDDVWGRRGNAKNALVR
jgi:hypothetical protein